MKICIYVLTHKKFEENYDKNLYKPILNGSSSLPEHFDYLTDDTGDNISKLNKYYAELTGQYWVWKNSNDDIIGFNHYRRWFARNLKFDKLKKEDILKDLKENDIILPQKTKLQHSLGDTLRIEYEKNSNYGVKWEDYTKLEYILENDYPNYYMHYRKLIKSKECYNNNMFICKKDLADEYFSWLFEVLNKLKQEIDFSTYSEDNQRVLGFLSEILLNVFAMTNNLKIKEHYLYYTERKYPLLFVIRRRFPIFIRLENSLKKMISHN